MNWPKRRLIFKSLLAIVLFALTSCGVKGDPLPPEHPPNLGRGRPTYRRASEEIKIEKNRGQLTPDDTDKDSDKEDSDDDEKE